MTHDAQHADQVFGMILSSLDSVPQVRAAAEPVQNPTLFSDWHAVAGAEGKLAVDVCETTADVVVVSTMAGAVPDTIEVYVHGDMLTIRGSRPFPLPPETIRHTYHDECFWGSFSRTIVLPIDVTGELAHAEYRQGVLMVFIPKAEERRGSIPVVVVEE